MDPVKKSVLLEDKHEEQEHVQNDRDGIAKIEVSSLKLKVDTNSYDMYSVRGNNDPATETQDETSPAVGEEQHSGDGRYISHHASNKGESELMHVERDQINSGKVCIPAAKMRPFVRRSTQKYTGHSQGTRYLRHLKSKKTFFEKVQRGRLGSKHSYSRPRLTKAACDGGTQKRASTQKCAPHSRTASLVPRKTPLTYTKRDYKQSKAPVQRQSNSRQLRSRTLHTASNWTEKTAHREKDWSKSSNGEVALMTEDVMKELLDSTPNNIILSMVSPNSDFLQKLTEPAIEATAIELMLDLLAKAISAEHGPENVVVLLNALKDSHFIRASMTKYLLEQRLKPVPPEQPLMKLAFILKQLLQRFPSSSLSVVLSLIVQLQYISSMQNSKQTLSSEIREVHKMYEDVRRRLSTGEMLEDQEADSSWQIPPDDFRDLPLMPTARDISANAMPFLRKNLIFGAYQDANHYLDVHFRLFREDFIAPLRQGIQELVQAGVKPLGKHLQDIRVYTGVEILKPRFTRDGIFHEVRFDVSHLKRLKWERSKRLIYGSLVVLSKDRFQTVICGTVVARELDSLKEGIIQIAFKEQPQIVARSFHKIYEMVESSTYFEAYKYTLEGLKELGETIPFQNYLLNAPDATLSSPRYLQDGEPKLYDFNCLLQKPKKKKVPTGS